MIYALSVPTTIEDNEGVRVLEWHATEGEGIAAGALLIELETHKALIEVRAGQDAVLRRRCVEEGGWCLLGARLALLSDTADEALCDDAQEWTAEFAIS